MFIAGAAFFVLSDSLLAINKFHTSLQCSFMVMVTYCLAQYLVVKGVILLENKKAATPSR
ncbi:MAG: hypothetical protein EOO03_10470 [Chitinophagaceae bacterium]|nr:MAG: hypothetical protein EOO03_10470 [Chitinophagaceae bacterium]